MHLLIAEDDQRLSRLLKRGLESEGHVVDVALDGDAALVLALSDGFDLCVLDVMMPGIDGFEVLRRMRDGGVATPVLMLTARGELEDRVRGLDAGADDYLVKPFEFDELVARIRALGRRRGDVEQAVLQVGDVHIDRVRHQVRRADNVIELSPTEFRLLEYLMRHAGQVLSRRSILAHVWGYEDEPDTNSVDLYVHYLRRKLGDDVPIVTVRGFGYRFEHTEAGR